MASEIDPRIIKVGIEINGYQNIYESSTTGYSITATGTKYANANQNECEVTIVNLKKDTRDFLLTQTSPYNLSKTPKRIYVYAGRKSYGTTLIYKGDITASSGSQPSDIGITLKSLAENYEKGALVSRSLPDKIPLQQVAQSVATDLGVNLEYQVTQPKLISNYNYSGAKIKQVKKLGEMGNIDTYLDNGVLYVKDARVPLNGRVRVLDLESGMVGIPEFIETGVKVKFLLDNFTVLGGALQIKSIMNPAANGSYCIYKLGFEIASREEPFYWIAEATRIQV